MRRSGRRRAGVGPWRFRRGMARPARFDQRRHHADQDQHDHDQPEPAQTAPFARRGRLAHPVGGAHRYRPEAPAASPGAVCRTLGRGAAPPAAGIGQRVAQLRHMTVRPSGVRWAAQTMKRKPQHGQVIPITKIPTSSSKRISGGLPQELPETGRLSPVGKSPSNETTNAAGFCSIPAGGMSVFPPSDGELWGGQGSRFAFERLSSHLAARRRGGFSGRPGILAFKARSPRRHSPNAAGGDDRRQCARASAGTSGKVPSVPGGPQKKRRVEVFLRSK